MKDHLVVIGGGQAAAQAIQSARQKGYDGKISLVAEETYLPYQRPPLSKKYLAGELPRERLQLKAETFYTSRDVDLLLGIRALELDRGHKRVRLADGGELTYTHLLIATGSRVRQLDAPGADLEGVHTLRSIADVDAIATRFKPGQQLVIIGAGYIGLEVAAVASTHGLHVTVLEAQDRVMARAVCPEISRFYANYHRQRGVAIHCNTTVHRLLGAESVQSVEVDSGASYRADLVIVGIGVLPNIALAERAGIECNNGIRVDEFGWTQDASIAAAGDCTNHRHSFVGEYVRLESVQNAIEQSKAAVSVLVGEPRAFDEVPWFWSDQYDLKLQIAGLSLNYDQIVVRGDMESNAFSVYYLLRGRPIAIDAINRPRDFMNGKKLLAARPHIPAAVIADIDADLTPYYA